MTTLKEYIEEKFNDLWDYVVEMATIGYPVLNRTNHFIALHGTNAGDRERPHIHIYLEKDRRPFNKFNFEIALDEILCYDEINLIRMKDSSRNIDYKHRSKCSWDRYNKLREDFENWLFNEPVELRGEYVDNLDAIIYFYNMESGGNRDKNPLLEYINNKGMKILDRFRKYFSKQDQERYTKCFT